MVWCMAWGACWGGGGIVNTMKNGPRKYFNQLLDVRSKWKPVEIHNTYPPPPLKIDSSCDSKFRNYFLAKSTSKKKWKHLAVMIGFGSKCFIRKFDLTWLLTNLKSTCLSKNNLDIYRGQSQKKDYLIFKSFDSLDQGCGIFPICGLYLKYHYLYQYRHRAQYWA